MTTYRYLTVAQWGGKWKGQPIPEKLADPEVFVHHVGGAAWMDGTAESVFQQLNAYAQGTKGYQFLDYDSLVHYDRKADVVTIGEGRGQYRSAATLDRNEEGEAIVLCGNTDVREPLPVELEGIARGIKWMVDKGWAAKTSRILGHRDNPAHPGATQCPGRFLYAKLPQIRTRVTELMKPPPTPEETVIHFDLPDSTLASVRSMPPTSAVLDGTGRNDDWWSIGMIKGMQAFCGLPVTGRYDQATGEAINAEMAKRGVKL